ncbi:conserved protein of unknown function [Candidatus Promineifilum breve]|uniref:Sulfotransferase n=1 Tax=Candidatus Promineifilum breve TaxID=1806508 RepID=A0A160T1H7_9CHLR|nr:hypothetical protein [Candidatus Promineifilum breve]CUS03424.2 conserved protein of unknown function [Candidatus Promineifilum breve]
MSKKVIFVGGTSYSGSTFFHLTIANDPRGFGIGEVKHLFRPTKERHTRPTWACGCGDPNCDLWSRVKKHGEANLYQTIFDIHPEVEFIVDASKNVVWIDDQTDYLARQGIETHHVVIWKTLLEYAHSLQKRNRLDKKDGAELAHWPQYHRNFYSFVDSFRTVKYADYARRQADVLQAACATFGIPYFAGKERYWEKTHHALGGNLSSRIHLYSKESDRYRDVQRRAEGRRNDLGENDANYRQVYYESPDESVLLAHVGRLRGESPTIDQVEEMLIAHDIAGDGPPAGNWPELKLGAIDYRMKQLRQFTRTRISKIRFAQ